MVITILNLMAVSPHSRASSGDAFPPPLQILEELLQTMMGKFVKRSELEGADSAYKLVMTILNLMAVSPHS